MQPDATTASGTQTVWQYVPLMPSSDVTARRRNSVQDMASPTALVRRASCIASGMLNRNAPIYRSIQRLANQGKRNPDGFVGLRITLPGVGCLLGKMCGLRALWRQQRASEKVESDDGAQPISQPGGCGQDQAGAEGRGFNEEMLPGKREERTDS